MILFFKPFNFSYVIVLLLNFAIIAVAAWSYYGKFVSKSELRSPSPNSLKVMYLPISANISK